jgi:prevent-host-death family protein
VLTGFAEELMTKASWTVAEAEARLPEVIAQARHRPQMITTDGVDVVVMVSAEAWRRRDQLVAVTAPGRTVATAPLPHPRADPERPAATSRGRPFHPFIV